MLLIQCVFNAILAFFVYKILVEPSIAKGGSHTIFSTSYLFAFGVAIPLVVMEPIYLMEYLDIKSPGLGMAFLATPIVNSLRITEGKRII